MHAKSLPAMFRSSGQDLYRSYALRHPPFGRQLHVLGTRLGHDRSHLRESLQFNTVTCLWDVACPGQNDSQQGLIVGEDDRMLLEYQKSLTDITQLVGR